MSGESKNYILRAMARNYADSGHSWDHLDSKVCAEAADEIDTLRTANQRLEGEVARMNGLLFEQAYRLERALDAADKAALSTTNGEVTE